MRNSISKMNPVLRKLLISTTGVLVVLIFWGLLSLRYHPLILPSPYETWQALCGLWTSGALWTNLIITLRRTIMGYALGFMLGCLLALLLQTSKVLSELLRPIITMVQVIPPIIWVVLAVIWFGIADDLTPVFLILIVTFPVAFINVFNGLESIDQHLVEMAKLYRCPNRKMITKIYLPALSPHLVSAASLGISLAWKSTIFAEYIGSSKGIGYALSRANSYLETDKLFAWTLVLIVFMLIGEYGILQPLKKRITRWNLHDQHS